MIELGPISFVDEDGQPVDQYGNPIDGSRLIYCCFPDCGCSESRLCMAERPNELGYAEPVDE